MNMKKYYIMNGVHLIYLFLLVIVISCDVRADSTVQDVPGWC
jgi:hypothetical protein